MNLHTEMNNIEKTGYPSVDRPWLKYYDQNADQVGYNIPQGKTVWTLFREILLSQSDIPAIEYFGKKISRPEFVSTVEKWAKAFKAIGIEAEEIIPIYSAVFPDICAMFFALNAVGATPYFLKLDSSTQELDQETRNSRFAIVYDGMWTPVSKVFSQKRFEKVIVVGAQDSMPAFKKNAVSILSRLKHKQFPFSENHNCIAAKTVLKLADTFTGDYEEPFAAGRIAAITVSSGTTASGVKGIMDTNESIIASVMMTAAARIRYFRGRKLLLEMPLMASTSLNCLFLLPLYCGMILIIDPRLSKDTWFRHIMEYKPSVTICTGAFWELFFMEVEKRISNGEKFDFSFADYFIMGGAGTTPEKLEWMNRILLENGAEAGIFSGYGLSEIFGVLSVDQFRAERTHRLENCPVINVGIPIPGFLISVHDQNGKELPYGERGELWVSSPTMMHGYYGKPELTDRTLIEGQVHTGDLCAIDGDGFIYYYGRLKNQITINDEVIYLFDIANDIRIRFSLADCMVERKDLEDGTTDIVVYLAVHTDRSEDSGHLIESIDRYLSPKMTIGGYKVFLTAIPANPATLKPRTNDLDGFVKYIDGKKHAVSYEKHGDGLRKTIEKR